MLLQLYEVGADLGKLFHNGLSKVLEQHSYFFMSLRFHAICICFRSNLKLHYDEMFRKNLATKLDMAFRN